MTLRLPPRVRLYNTLARRKEELQPLQPGQCGIYSCGPTVYRYVHLGNLRTFMFADLLCRVLEYNGIAVRQVKNITDVGHLTDDTFERGEDKMLVAARLEHKSSAELADYYTAAFHEDERRLNIRPADVYPRASVHIPQMIELIERLIRLGHAYEATGSVYFDIASFPAYGRLSGNTPERLRAGIRGEVDPHKRSPGDFALWRAGGPRRAMTWPSPWGEGFPGWHIECSAMSMTHLGDRFDIHTGGVDNIFPHHEAEIAQSESAVGHRVVGCWMHAQHLTLSGVRMAKSAGNFVRVTDLESDGYDPLAFRYLALQARYRRRMTFSPEGVRGADRALRQLRGRLAEWTDGPGSDEAGYRERFLAAINDDLDLPNAMAVTAELARSDLPAGTKARLLLDFDRVFALDLDREVRGRELPPGASSLLAARERARAARDWQVSDRLREELAALGVAVIDSPEGQRWKRVSPRRSASD